MVTDEKRREVARKLRLQLFFMRENEKWYARDGDPVECGNRTYRSIAWSVIEHGNLIDGNYCDIVKRLIDLIDRPTCRNIYDESKAGACENGFECSECGNVVEDDEGWLVNGTFNYCSECGREAVE